MILSAKLTHLPNLFNIIIQTGGKVVSFDATTTELRALRDALIAIPAVGAP